MAEIPKEAAKFKGATRERIRRGVVALLERALRGDKKAITVAALRGEVGGDQTALTTCLRLWRAGEWSVADSWEDAPQGGEAKAADPDDPRAQLAKRIRDAATDGDREGIAQEVAAMVASSVLAPDEAAQIKGALAEARLAADAKRANEPPPEDPRTLLLASPEAMQAARAIDWLVDDARRDRVLALVAAELEADQAQHPNADEGGA